MTGEMAVIGPVAAAGADVVPSPPSLDQVREFIRASKAENTLRGYQSDWRDFCQWCDGRGLAPLPALPDTVAAYIADCASRLKVGSIQRRLNAIAQAHKAMGLESPTHSAMVANTMKGIHNYRFTAERFNVGLCDFGANARLQPQAGNLPEVLGVLQSNPKLFDNFNEAVTEVLPQVGRVTVAPEGDRKLKILVWSQAAYQAGREDLAVRLDESGTGIGQVLAMLYIVLTSHTPQVLLIDEPQSFLHPGAARKLIEVLKRHSQHQYIVSTHSPTIITAAQPNAIILITHDGNESALKHLDSTDADQLKKYLDEIGASLADVFGADGILWVEGPTEEKCYPLIIEGILRRPMMGKVIKATIATGDFEGRHAERFFEIYGRLSAAQSLIPPAVAFLFDDEGRTPQVKKELEHLSKGLVRFTKRRMYENYLLDARAIVAVANATEGHTKEVDEAAVREYIEHGLSDDEYFKPISVDRGIEWIRADILLKRLFWDLAALDFRKTTHSVELTRWLIEHDPGKLADVAEMMRNALGWDAHPN